MTKNNLIASVLALFTVLFLSDFRLLETIYLWPNIVWVFPLFGFYYLSVVYFANAFKTKLKVSQKVLMIVFGGVGIASLLYLGFCIWKTNQGNILLENKDAFQVNLKNVFFWVMYQSYLLLLFFSSFKQLVTIDQR